MRKINILSGWLLFAWLSWTEYIKKKKRRRYGLIRLPWPFICAWLRIKMKTLVLTVVLVEFLVNSAWASNAIQLINKGNDGGTVYQTVNINHNVNVAAFNTYVGTHSTNAIIDYNAGLIVYHMPYKRICVVSRFNRRAFPSISELENLIQEENPSLHALHRNYGISRQLVTNFRQLGQPIQAICGGLTTYWATEYQNRDALIKGKGCAGVHLLFLDVNLCGGLSLF